MEVRRPTITLVLREGGDFSFRDVELIARHIHGKWKGAVRPRILCFWDNASEYYNLGNIELIPLPKTMIGTWARMHLYSPEVEQYKPFLYVDLDTIVVRSLENLFNLITDESKFITLEDLWYKQRKIATALVWFPANCAKTKMVWDKFERMTGKRMDYYLRAAVGGADAYWQDMTNTIYDFKERTGKLLVNQPNDATIVCLHGKPRLFDAAQNIPWVRNYVETYFEVPQGRRKVSVIIPFNRDRGYLQDAVASVPSGVQLILAKGDGNWPQNFNKALAQAEGDYIKYLHEDDMLTPNCIRDSVWTLESTGADFIHGNAMEMTQETDRRRLRTPRITDPSLRQMLLKNHIHSATTMYRRTVFDRVGLFNESDEVRGIEEYEFNLRCLKAGLRLRYCNSVLAIYRRHAEQLVKEVKATPEAKAEHSLRRTKIIAQYR